MGDSRPGSWAKASRQQQTRQLPLQRPPPALFQTRHLWLCKQRLQHPHMPAWQLHHRVAPERPLNGGRLSVLTPHFAGPSVLVLSTDLLLSLSSPPDTALLPFVPESQLWGESEPVTSGPALAKHPNGGTRGNGRHCPSHPSIYPINIYEVGIGPRPHAGPFLSLGSTEMKQKSCCFFLYVICAPASDRGTSSFL